MTLQFLSQKEQISLYLEDLYSKFGFDKYKVNRFEEYAFYMGQEQFLSDNRVLTFTDPHGKLMALKPDVTMSIVKNCVQDTNHKIYYNESVFRIPKGEDAFKELHQVGLEFIGENSPYQTLELLNLASKSLARISGDYRLCLSNTALILLYMEQLDLTTVQKGKIINFMSQKNGHDLDKYIQEENISSGERFRQLLSLPTEAHQGLDTLSALFSEEVYRETLEEFTTTVEHLLAIVPDETVYLDFSHIPSTEYYQGLVFSGYIHGIPMPALSGGRYDTLLHRMGNTHDSAMGFAVNLSVVDTLFSTTEKEYVEIQGKPEDSPIALMEQANKLYEEGKSFHVTMTQKGGASC